VSGWLLGCSVLIVAGLVPALYLGGTGNELRRLIGLEMASAIAALVMLGFIQDVKQPSYLIVPLVLVLLSFAGRRRPAGSGEALNSSSTGPVTCPRLSMG
jgi:multisubunit Na+/H+ antiporter MnhF subunit